MRSYDTYELHKWLLKRASHGCNDSDYKTIVDMQVAHAKELIELRQDPLPAIDDFLRVAIELSHVLQGSEGLTQFAEHMRGMADSIDVRVRRGSFRTVSNVGKPANEG
jgi:hypothetical protein